MGFGSMAKKKSTLTHYLILIMVLVCMGFILIDFGTNVLNDISHNEQVVETSVPSQPTPTFSPDVTLTINGE